jgi:hypothetical protein
MSSPLGHIAHPKSRILANRSAKSRMADDLPPLVPLRAFCDHGHATVRCSICLREHEARLGLFAPRL